MDIGKELLAFLPEDRIRTRYIDRATFGSDAGFYYLLPKAVVHPVSETEIVALFAFSRKHGIPLVFRAGGTSLSGQSVTDGILVELSRQWSVVEPQAEGRIVRVGPGVTGAMVNARLKTFHRKIGPDPSSIATARMGGILSNNSSGMCCGVSYNSYHTLRHIRFILPGGVTFDTADPADYGRFVDDPSGIASELSALRSAILADVGLQEKIGRKYRTKNTVGYSLNAFVDYEHPLDIFAHLLIGAEGTLAFIASASLLTIPQLPHRSTGLLYFADLHVACNTIPALVGAGAEAVELMDRASLRAVENIPGMPAVLKTLPPKAAALLVEFHGESNDQLKDRLRQFLATPISTLNTPQFTEDLAEQELLWNVRKGLFPSVGAVRKSGTTVILEDIAFPVHRLADAITDLQALFAEFGYDNAIIFGHAKDGNIHFVITQSFGTQSEINRYAKFIDRLVPLVVDKYDGALKAEHGTGRNMAPFVETEWGPAAYRIMQRLKTAVDPMNLLNPGVIISPDEQLHLKDLKQMPPVEPEVDKCIECGYCEPVCPSRDLTMTPRRRIVARRTLKLLEAAADTTNHRELLRQFKYDGLETCAVDGLCAGACPVEINTGDLVKRLRRENHSAKANRTAMFVAQHFAAAERLSRSALSCGATINRLFGSRTMSRMTHIFRKVIPSMPLWPEKLSGAPKLPKPSATPGEQQIVYLPSCVTRMLQLRNGEHTMDTLLRLADKTGIGVILPQNIHGACCGQLFSSKGYASAYRYTANRMIASLWDLTQNGRLPVVMDVSSCTYTMLHYREELDPENRKRFDMINILDVVDFLHDLIIPLTSHIRPIAEVVLHPVCSLHKMGNYAKFLAVARHFAAKVTVPQHSGCCGMAGDRGFLFPELTAAATAGEAAEVKTTAVDGYYSSAVSCELAMSEATGKTYTSIIRLAADALFVS